MFKARIRYKGPNGERFNSAGEMFDSITKHVENLAYEHGREQLEQLAGETVRKLRCPEHGSGVTKVTASRQGAKAQLAVEGCCQKFIETSKGIIAAALKEQSQEKEL